MKHRWESRNTEGNGNPGESRNMEKEIEFQVN